MIVYLNVKKVDGIKEEIIEKIKQVSYSNEAKALKLGGYDYQLYYLDMSPIEAILIMNQLFNTQKYDLREYEAIEDFCKF